MLEFDRNRGEEELVKSGYTCHPAVTRGQVVTCPAAVVPRGAAGAHDMRVFRAQRLNNYHRAVWQFPYPGNETGAIG